MPTERNTTTLAGDLPVRSYPPAGWQFIMDVLTGVRNPVTGRRKEDRHGKVARKRGPSARIVATSLTRRFTPVGAYFEIVGKLRTQFPKQKQKDIRRRALSITSELWRLDENTLANKLKKDAERKHHLARKRTPIPRNRGIFTAAKNLGSFRLEGVRVMNPKKAPAAVVAEPSAVALKAANAASQSCL